MIPLAHDFRGETVLVFGGGSVGARKARRFAREAHVVVVSPRFADADFGAGPNGVTDAESTATDADGGVTDTDDGVTDMDGAVDAESGEGPDDGPTAGDGPTAQDALTADDTAGDVDLVRAAPDPGAIPDWIDRTDPALAVAATDDEALNGAIARAARDHGALVNRADRDARDGDRAVGDVAVPATVREDPVVVAISTGGASPALAKALRERIEHDLAGAGSMAELTAGLRDRLVAEGFDPGARRAAVRAVVRSPDVWTALRAGEANPRQITEDVVAGVLEDR